MNYYICLFFKLLILTYRKLDKVSKNYSQHVRHDFYILLDWKIPFSTANQTALFTQLNLIIVCYYIQVSTYKHRIKFFDSAFSINLF